jgi:hypothetical protein
MSVAVDLGSWSTTIMVSVATTEALMFACRTAMAKAVAVNRIELAYAGELAPIRPHSEGPAYGIDCSP